MITTLVDFLAPCLPFLWEKVGTPALESAAGKMGEETWEKAQAMWSKLFPKIEQDEATKVVAAELAKNPESDIWKAAFQEKLQALLDSDEALKQAIAKMLQDEEAATVGTSIKITVDKNEGQFIGQMNNGEAKNIVQIGNIRGDIN